MFNTCFYTGRLTYSTAAFVQQLKAARPSLAVLPSASPISPALSHLLAHEGEGRDPSLPDRYKGLRREEERENSNFSESLSNARYKKDSLKPKTKVIRQYHLPAHGIMYANSSSTTKTDPSSFHQQTAQDSHHIRDRKFSKSILPDIEALLEGIARPLGYGTRWYLGASAFSYLESESRPSDAAAVTYQNRNLTIKIQPTLHKSDLSRGSPSTLDEKSDSVAKAVAHHQAEWIILQKRLDRIAPLLREGLNRRRGGGKGRGPVGKLELRVDRASAWIALNRMYGVEV